MFNNNRKNKGCALEQWHLPSWVGLKVARFWVYAVDYWDYAVAQMGYVKSMTTEKNCSRSRTDFGNGTKFRFSNVSLLVRFKSHEREQFNE